MFAIRTALSACILLSLQTCLFGQALFVKPIKVLGDPHFVGTANNPLAFTSAGPNWVEGKEMNAPQGLAVDLSAGSPVLYVADTFNNRVLGFKNATQLVSGAKADIVLGQQDFFSTNSAGPGTSASTGLSAPTGLVTDAAGNLYVADTGNNRILRYPKPFSQPAGYQYPDMVIGQPNFTSGTGNPTGVKANSLLLNNGSFLGRTGLAMDAAGNLFIADVGNNRVLRYSANALKNGANNPNADFAVGQQDLISSSQPTTRIDKTTLFRPTGIGFDSEGRLYVGDGANRVLVYGPGVGANTSALRILGIPTNNANTAPSEISFGTSSSNQFGICAYATGVVVTDFIDNRALVYSGFSTWTAEATQFSPSAVAVIGQASFGDSKANLGNPEPSSNSLNAPADVAFSGTELYIVDGGNNRVLVYTNNPGPVISGFANRVLGQLDFPYSAVNLIEGREFDFAINSGTYGSVVLDTSVSPARLYVADTFNNRVLGFSNFNALKNGDLPDVVIGQPDLRRNQVNYPANDANKPNAQGLNQPTSLAIDKAGNVYVADTGNSRVLRFASPFSGTKSLPTANLVIGQSNFTSIVTDASSRTMRKPIAIALSNDAKDPTLSTGFLVVSDAALNRVELFAQPFTNGVNASTVLGQFTLQDSAAGSDIQHFNTPRGVALNQFDRIIVADSGNARLCFFDRAFSLSNLQTPQFTVKAPSTQSNLTSVAVSADGDFWVTDVATNAVYHYPSISNLPLKNFASDATTPVVGPHTAYVDSFKNLIVGDQLNRVLYFAPQVTIENASNYSQRPLSPGTIASIFPSAQNVLASATQTFDSLPNPIPVTTTLADTQVIVNGTASSLFYVSPSQINLPLSYNLPQTGSVDVRVVRQSTGQILGGAELQMAKGSPGLFTIGAAGNGQAIAVHPDGSLNSTTNAIARGQYVTLYLTGQGSVSGAPPDGQITTVPIPNPALPVITLNNGSAQYTIPASNILYSGIAPGLVGVWQINVTIPPAAPSGTRVSLIVQQYGYTSVDPTSAATQAATTTTIAIK